MSLLGSILKVGVPLAATAIGGPLAGAAAGSVIGGIESGSASKKAAKAAATAADKTIAAANANRDFQYSINQPTIDRGNAAGSLYANFLGAGAPTINGQAYLAANPDAAAQWATQSADLAQFGGDVNKFAQFHYTNDGSRRSLDGLTTDPAAAALGTFRGSTGYQDLLKTGLDSVNANAYAKGLGGSGAALKALQNKGVSIADQSAQSWLGGLQNLQAFGQQAAGTVAGVGGNTVGVTSGANQYAGSAQANAALAGAAATNQSLQNLLNLGAKAFGSSYGG